MKIANYIRESYNELVHKVSWPTPKELSNSAMVVLIASLIIALVVWLIDFGVENIKKYIYKLIS